MPELHAHWDTKKSASPGNEKDLNDCPGLCGYYLVGGCVDSRVQFRLIGRGSLNSTFASASAKRTVQGAQNECCNSNLEHFNLLFGWVSQRNSDPHRNHVVLRLPQRDLIR